MKKQIIKTISWRIIGTLDTAFLAWLITGNFKNGIAISGLELVTKSFLYFLHEIAWKKK